MIFASLTTSLVLENVKSGEYAETKSSNTSKHLENKPHKRIQYIQCAEQFKSDLTTAHIKDLYLNVKVDSCGREKVQQNSLAAR